MANEIYRNGKIFGGGSTLPTGGTKGQALVKHSNANDDFEWADIGGAIFAYIVGDDPFEDDWLSETPSGDPLTPQEGLLYLVLTEGPYYSSIYRYDETLEEYLPVTNVRIEEKTMAEYIALPASKNTDGVLYLITDGRSPAPAWSEINGVIYSYIVGATPFAPDWLSTSPSGAPVPPVSDRFYIILTVGDYENLMVRYDDTARLYVAVSGKGTELPAGGLKGQALLKKSNADGDFEWGDIKGVTYTYIVGDTPLADDWLSLTDAGDPLTPEEGMVYLIVSDGSYCNKFVRWDGTDETYILFTSDGQLLTGVLDADSWDSNNTQTVLISGITASSDGVIGLLNNATQAQVEAARASLIRCTGISSGAISFVCEVVPDIDIPFGVILGGGSGGAASGGVIYSTTEQEIGLWIDNKPLYQITLIGTTIDDVTGDIETGLTNIDYCHLISFQCSTGTYRKNLLDSVAIKNDGTLIAMVADSLSEFKDKQFYATVQYTKLV